MGDNYRASDTQPNEHWRELVRQIKSRETGAQKRRAFMDKLIVGGAMAGLTGIAGAAKASQSYSDEMDQKRALRAKKDDQFNRTFRPEQSQSGSAPAWLGEHGEGNASAVEPEAPAPAEPVDMSLPADRAKANMGLNAAASKAEFGGYRTRDGNAEHADIAGSIARDIGTARQGMTEGQQMGGMGNSLVRNPAQPDAYHDPTDDYFGTTGGR